MCSYRGFGVAASDIIDNTKASSTVSLEQPGITVGMDLKESTISELSTSAHLEMPATIVGIDQEDSSARDDAPLSSPHTPGIMLDKDQKDNYVCDVAQSDTCSPGISGS